MKHIVTFICILLLWSCTDRQPEKFYLANLKALTDTTQGISEQTLGLQAGGVGKVKIKKVKYVNSNCKWEGDSVEGSLILSVVDTFGAVEGSMDILQLPIDWKKFKLMKVNLQNMNNFEIYALVDIIGSRNVLTDSIILKPGESKVAEFSLLDLPLTARIQNIYQPVSLRLGIWSKQKNAALKISGLKLIQTSDTLPIAIVDKYGQRVHTHWKSKLKSDQDFQDAIERERKQLDTMKSFEDRNIYGGWSAGKKFTSTGFFRVEKTKEAGVEKWWFVDPDGSPFWSLGVTGVRTSYWLDVTPINGREHLYQELPDSTGKDSVVWNKNGRLNFYRWNVYRKYKNLETWREKVLTRMTKWGLNTIGNWSDDQLLKQSTMPFTKSYRTTLKPSLYIGEGLCDVFNPEWAIYIDSVLSDAKQYSQNKYLLGYFIDNEQGWEEMNLLNNLPNTSNGRDKWLQMIQKKYTTLLRVNRSWKTGFTDWQQIRNITNDTLHESVGFANDYIELEKEFATIYFSLIKQTLKKIDPNHLYLGCRFTRKLKPAHITKIAGLFSDVITVNVYSLFPNREDMAKWYAATGKPILIGEHHLPLKSQRQLPPNYQCFTPQERFVYYQQYVQKWAAMPFSLGCHWYQFVDQNLTGRVNDGENQTVGLVDVTDQPHEDIQSAITKISKEIYKLHNESE